MPVRTASVLYRGGRIYCPGLPQATALLVRDGRIAWLGADEDAPRADEVVDLAGALVTPAFVDAHVHMTDTGRLLSGLDLSAARSAAEVLDAVAACAGNLPGDAVVVGHGWDESTWGEPTLPSAAELDRAAGGRPVYLTHASMHAALCSTALLARAPVASTPDVDSSGLVRGDAHVVVRQAALGAIPRAQRSAWQRRALRHAASLGIAAVHECGGPGICEEDDFTGLLALSGDGLPEVYGYWGELGAAAKARDLGAVGAGGDLHVDGAIGAHTAFVSTPYADRGGHGCAYLTVDHVRDHLLDCAAHGVQGGFHAIGDAAIDTVVRGMAAAAETLGVEWLRAARHRVEHALLATKQLIARFVEFGVIASVQPSFDRLWGGPSGMYAQRLGPQRALEANPLGAMHTVGVSLAFGSDAPVTPLDPWGSIRAAISHANPTQRISVRAAFAAHTRGGWRAVGRDADGTLVPGAAATFAVWDTPAGLAEGLPVLVAADPAARGPHDPTPLPVCRRTVLRGTVIYQADA